MRIPPARSTRMLRARTRYFYRRIKSRDYKRVKQQ